MTARERFFWTAVGRLRDIPIPVVKKSKKLISFRPEMLEWLAVRAVELEVSASEVIRRLVDKERKRLGDVRR